MLWVTIICEIELASHSNQAKTHRRSDVCKIGAVFERSTWTCILDIFWSCLTY